MFKNLHFIILVAIFISNLFVGVGYAEELPNLTAKSAIVIEAKTGKIIYARDAQSRRYPASTTKMMTLIVALEKGNLTDIVTASKAASETEGSSIWLEHDEKLTLEDLLYGVMLVSGNDATVAVAEHIAGSVPAFARLMTQKAHEIGADHTNFVNSSGLPDENHYSTAYDLAKIAAYGYKNPQFEKFVSAKEKVIPWAAKEFGRDLRNENRMLWLYEGGNGVKTGYTEAAGRCLVSAAKRDGVQLIAVVLDSEYMWNDSIALLDYGFSKIAKLKLYQQGDILQKIKVLAGEKDEVALTINSDIDVPIVNGDREHFKTIVDVPERVYANVEKGQKIGQVKILYKDTEIATQDLVATENIKKKSFFAKLYHLFNKIWMAIIG